MGLAEAIVFVVVGWVTIFHQRSLLPKLSNRPTSATTLKPNLDKQNLALWVIAVILPILGLAWVISQQISLPITVITIAFLLCIGIAQSPRQELGDPVPTLSPQQEKQLKECFLSGLYQLKAIEYHHSSQPSYHQIIYCRGHLRSRNYKYVYDTINQNIYNAFGDRFLCRLQAKPLENIGTDFGDRDISLTDDPALDQALRYSFYLIPNPKLAPSPSPKSFQKLTAPITKTLTNTITILSMALTSLTLLMVGSGQTIDQFINNFPNQIPINQLQSGLPYALGMAIVIITRAIARYAIARYHRIHLPYRLCLPSVLPCFGGFGYLGEIAPNLAQIMQSDIKPDIKSGVKPHHQRRILFDLAAIPSLVAIGVSIAIFLVGGLGGYGLNAVTNVTIEAANADFMVPLSKLSLNDSMFAALWQSLIKELTTSAGFAGDPVTILSPLTLAGFVGMVMSALQLLPLQGLDGEYLAIAMNNHHQIAKLARSTRLIILAIALFDQPWLRLYSLLLFLLPTPRPLICNEGVELDKKRDWLGFVLMAIALLILLPVPRFLIN